MTALAEVILDKEIKYALESQRDVIFDNVGQGKRVLGIKVFGNRMITFGALHDNTSSRWCYGAQSYRTSGDAWTYGYRFRLRFLLFFPSNSARSRILNVWYVNGYPYRCTASW